MSLGWKNVRYGPRTPIRMDELVVVMNPIYRPEIERDYDTMKPMIEAAFTPYYTAMLNDVATVYANNFTVGELREIEAFYRQPIGQKLLEKTPALTQQSNQAGQDASRKAAEDLRTRVSEALRQKGHKL